MGICTCSSRNTVTREVLKRLKFQPAGLDIDINAIDSPSDLTTSPCVRKFKSLNYSAIGRPVISHHLLIRNGFKMTRFVHDIYMQSKLARN